MPTTTAPTHKLEFGVYLPQMKIDYTTISQRVQLADELGYDTAWFYDHFYPPGAPDVPGMDGWTLMSALAVQTQRIRLGQLVLCNAFRHPAQLARQAVTLDVISKGRLELGLGTGSYLREFEAFGIPCPGIAVRSEQLDEACQVIKLLCSEPRANFEGQYYQLHNAPTALFPVQKPWPRITIGGGGERRTLPLVAKHADVWNCPTYSLGELSTKRDAMYRACEAIDRDPASLVFSQQTVLALAKSPAELPQVQELARKRFGADAWNLEKGGLIGTPEQVVEKLKAKIDMGFTQFALFFHDRGEPETLECFAREVMDVVKRDYP